MARIRTKAGHWRTGVNQSGLLFYLVGPSGVGKDSLLEALRIYPDLPALHLAERYITRPTRRGDDRHVEIDPDTFAVRAARGDFLFTWHSHGFSYAVSNDLLFHLRTGEDVLVNGSRAYLSTAMEIVPGLVPIWMRVSERVLRERLRGRARENAAAIERRLDRNRKLERLWRPEWHVIVNDDDIEQTCRQFLDIRERLRADS
ncbi:MAG: hypothetical protein QNJ85_15455 [Gammaproteobacteria bacterium]|nr:hypothetical protein [Gammaproteobacteria bacterium]